MRVVTIALGVTMFAAGLGINVSSAALRSESSDDDLPIASTFCHDKPNHHGHTCNAPQPLRLDPTMSKPAPNGTCSAGVRKPQNVKAGTINITAQRAVLYRPATLKASDTVALYVESCYTGADQKPYVHAQTLFLNSSSAISASYVSSRQASEPIP